MISLREQIESGKLVCPKSRQRLFFDETNSHLVTADASSKYPVINGEVPVLLTDPEWAATYTASGSGPTSESSSKSANAFSTWLKESFVRDHRTARSIEATRSVIANASSEAFCLAIGGGPDRIFPNVINLNIEAFPNVDVVADAHLLPYADESVDAIYCEAVLEHLSDPNLAVREMYRVLRPGGTVLAITPFLQPYHGYPHHYQNFTLSGHVHLFQSKGFEIAESGTCVGPTFALAVLIYNYIEEYLPLGRFFSKIFAAASLLVTPLDKLINRKPKAHIVASTTYVVASKGKISG